MALVKETEASRQQDMEQFTLPVGRDATLWWSQSFEEFCGGTGVVAGLRWAGQKPALQQALP